MTDRPPLLTSNWSTVHRLAYEQGLGGLDFTPVRTSLGLPRFWPAAKAFPYIDELAPKGLWLVEDSAEFKRRYVERLVSFGVDHLAVRFQALYVPGKPVCLLCFEASRDDCHRGLFARWWTEQTGQEVPELEVPAPPLDVQPAAQLTFDTKEQR